MNKPNLGITFLIWIFSLLLPLNLYANQYENCDTLRLIIGSGADVKKVYTSAREITECDVTIDFRNKQSDKFLNPTYVIDISNLKLMKEFSKKFPRKFDIIIFEHVGDGLASFVKSENELVSMIKIYFDMLKERGELIYEGFRGSLSFSDEHNDLGLSLPTVIEENYFEIAKLIHEKRKEKTAERIRKIITYYNDIFEKVGFKNISVKFEEDREYKTLHPNKAPYFYLEIKGIK